MVKNKLGRGLDAILGDVELAYEKELKNGKKDIVIDIDIDEIKPNPYQPRQNFDKEALLELSESIKRHGLIQPIIVIKKNNDYVLIAGERRLRATKLIGEKTIKAVVADIKSENLRELALIENIQRENLNPIELANSYKELIEEYKITQDELANIIKKSRTQITNTLRLLMLKPKSIESLSKGKISQGHAKVIVGLDEEELLVDSIIGQNLSVRQTEDLVKKIKNKKHLTQKNLVKDSEINQNLILLKEKLQNFGKINISNNKISIKFDNIEKIHNFLEKL